MDAKLLILDLGNKCYVSGQLSAQVTVYIFVTNYIRGREYFLGT
jgi:hypothetical protein